MGLDAIAEHNGWAMAVTGIIIVMLGLSVLAFIISQLHRVIGLFEEKKRSSAKTSPPLEFDILNDPETTARVYKPLTESLGDHFQLIELYRVFEEEKLPHPHLTISVLREAGYLLPTDGKGEYIWKKDQ